MILEDNLAVSETNQLRARPYPGFLFGFGDIFSEGLQGKKNVFMHFYYVFTSQKSISGVLVVILEQEKNPQNGQDFA